MLLVDCAGVSDEDGDQFNVFTLVSVLCEELDQVGMLFVTLLQLGARVGVSADFEFNNVDGCLCFCLFP